MSAESIHPPGLGTGPEPDPGVEFRTSRPLRSLRGGQRRGMQAPRAQMGVMRHHDMKLTMGTYADEAHISYREAIEKLPNILDLTPDSLTHPLTHGSVVSSPNVSPAVATGESEEESQLLFMQANRRGMTPVVARVESCRARTRT